MVQRKRIGIFGWGLVAPKSPNVRAFEENLERSANMLGPFGGFGPNNFLVGEPDFDFTDYRPWVNAHFEPRKFSQLDSKMGSATKFAIGAFIQALEQNPGLDQLLPELGNQAHVYVGTGLGDIPVHYESSLAYYKTLRRWNRFWCKPENHPKLAEYAQSDSSGKAEMRALFGAPRDPAELDRDDPDHDDALDEWMAFWVSHNDKLNNYVARLRAIEGESLQGDVESNKGHLIRRKLAAKNKLKKEVGCPVAPWAAVSPNILWNIDNMGAAQISMLGKITGTCMAPVAACSGFVTSLKMAENAINLGQAKVCVVGMTDPPPHEVTVAAFYGGRVISHDGEVSKPFSGMRGTHVAGGSCIWIVGDYDYLTAKGMSPVGLEIAGIGLTSDAHHIITPNEKGPRQAIKLALKNAGVTPDQIGTWDMHATATPGDWTELKNALAEFPHKPLLTARKGSFGHGMSVCGGWELMAQHLGLMKGKIYPVGLDAHEINETIRPSAETIVTDSPRPFEGKYAGKINMGVGGVNGCVICKTWD